MKRCKYAPGLEGHAAQSRDQPAVYDITPPRCGADTIICSTGQWLGGNKLPRRHQFWLVSNNLRRISPINF
jgi:hypothetical protein